MKQLTDTERKTALDRLIDDYAARLDRSREILTTFHDSNDMGRAMTQGAKLAAELAELRSARDSLADVQQEV